MSPVQKKRKIPVKLIILIVAAALVVILGFAFRKVFIVATVNGSPVSRMALVKGLEKSFAKQVLESLIAEKLITQGLDKANSTATDEEVNANIKIIEDRVTAQGTTLAKELEAEGATMAEFRTQVTLQTRIEKMFQDKTTVSDEDAVKYIKDNKVTVPAGKDEEAKLHDAIKNQLRLEKLSATVQEWVGKLRSEASINYLRKY